MKIRLLKLVGVSIACASILFITFLFDDIVSGAIFNENAIYFMKIAVVILLTSVLLLPVLWVLDFLFIRMIGEIFKDFIESDKVSRAIFILVFLLVLFRKIIIWIRY